MFGSSSWGNPWVGLQRLSVGEDQVGLSANGQTLAYKFSGTIYLLWIIASIITMNSVYMTRRLGFALFNQAPINVRWELN